MPRGPYTACSRSAPGKMWVMTKTFDRHVGEAWIERITAAGERTREQDELAVEEPLEIRVDGRPVAVTMRTPGEDDELAAGFLAGEGLITSATDITNVGPTDDFAANVVEVTTRRGLRRDPSAERSFYLSSSCGVCGKGALEYVRQAADKAQPSEPLTPEVILDAPGEARQNQAAFERTGGLHATALFDAHGELIVLREDVGRHNAMDKAIGNRILTGEFPLPGTYACVSGRTSFELVQKASLAGLAGVVGVGAPSTLAVDLAREQGMLLCGFVRGGSFNVYAGSDRIRA
jgi:FdhD protein